MNNWRICVRARIGAFELSVDLASTGGPMALIGPNGSGKTALLRVLAGAVTPAEGEIEVGGRCLFSRSRGIDLPIEARHVGYVPQGYCLFPHLSVLNNVAFGASTGRRKKRRTERRAEALSMLTELECGALAERFPPGLSGGEKQKVALARALITNPSLLLLDEPLSALDVDVRRRVRSFLASRIAAVDRPSVVVTHDPRDVAALDAPVSVLEEGRIVQQGSLEALRASPRNEFVAEFTELS